ncbi:MAG: RHS repeat protein, partial [Chloroflexi bacterium]|nr:RHS repeat protein [Chloroflexota bacterium]
MKIKSTTRIALAVLLFATMAVLSPPSVHADPPGPHGPGKEKLIGLGCDPITGMPAIEVWGVGLNKEIPVTVRAPDGKTATYTLRTDNAGNGKVEYGMPGEMYSLVAIHFADGRREFRNINCPPVGPKGSQGQKNSGSRATAGNSPGSGTAGDPISTSIGEYFFQMPLFDLGGPLPVQFALNYAASMDKSSGSDNDPFGGDNFSHNMHVALKRMDDTSAVIFFGSGNVVQFQKSANGWLVIAEETGYQLREGDAHYYLLDPIAELIYTFDKPGGAVAWLTRVEDRNGNTLTFTNDSTGRVTRVDDGKGRSLIFTYTDPSDTWTWAHLAQVSDGNDRAIKFEYKSTTEPLTTHLVSVSNALKQTTKFTHEGAITNTVVSAITYPLGNTPYTNKYEVINGQWAVTSQTDALGNTTQLKIDKSVATMTDALGNVTQHTHTDARLLSDMTDASNKSAAITYDDQGRRTEITDRLGDTTKIVYHPQTGNFASVTNAKGDTISYAYTAQEQTIGEAKFTFYNLTKVDYPDKTSAKFDYDAKGNVITYTDQAAQVWKFTYTPTGLPTTATNPANGVATFTYNPDQTLASRKDSETGDTRFTYDNFKRVTKITYADRSEVAFTYNANDQITSVTDPLKGVTKFEYDANGNLIKTTDAAGKETISTYDKMDRLIKTTNRLGQASSLAYDKLGRVESATDATGVMAQFAYDPRGWLNKIKLGESAWKYGYDDEGVVNSLTSPSGNTTKIQSDKIGLTSSATNALNQTSSLTRDASNRITKVTDPLKRDTSYTYDARGALNGVTAPVVGSSKYEYDAAGNLIKIVDLNGGEWKFTYSPMGRLLTETDPLGKVTQYKYDERGRLSLVTYPDASTRIISYDALGNIARVTFSDKIEKKFVYDALGRLIEADGVKFSRDAEGRITQTSEVFGDFGSLNGATYDNAGRVKTVAYNDGATSASLSASFTVTYVYDEKTGLLKQVTDSLTGTQIDFTYDEDLRLTKITRSNQVNTTLTWDNADRLIGIQDAKTSEVSQTSEV